MKLLAFYYGTDFEHLEYNHKNYCDQHNIEYNKQYIHSTPNPEAYKLALIFDFLQKNLGHICFFIDSFCYINNPKLLPRIEKDFTLQKNLNKGLDLTFFVLKSNEKTLKFFEKLLKIQSMLLLLKKDDNQGLEIYKQKYLQLINSEEEIVNYPKVVSNNQDKEFYLNGNVNSQNLLEATNVLALNVRSEDNTNERSYYIAESLCFAKKNKRVYGKREEKFEVFNPGNPNALVTLYDSTGAVYGCISEDNFKRYCLARGITLYIYRDTVSINNKKHGSGTWCKPFVLLNHIEQHKFIGWIDSDIILGKNFTLDFQKDIAVYKDIASWAFNAGFMVFKNTEKNKNLLQTVGQIISDPEKDTTSTYVGGGDQSCFIDLYNKMYGSESPISYFSANTHPHFPKPIRVSERHEHMLHFMGLPLHLRAALMKAFDQD
jgi:hypothetical protein